ncbi:MAG TPA: nuclear transport factor 2 family protein, partial [Actinomycetota bacterium]|nr:nuclear transport factor 2 family protein [Actinomycetota bacterium]
MDRADVSRWVDRYVKAWSSNDPKDIRALFTEDAAYFTAPDREPWRGADGIVKGWIDRKDEPGQWEFRYDVLAVTGDVAFVQGVTRYLDPPKDYSNLWVIR